MVVWLVVLNLEVQPVKAVEWKFGSPQECVAAAMALALEPRQFATCVVEEGGI